MEVRRRNEDEETLESLLSFHYVKIHDKIDALMMVRALQSKSLEDHLRIEKEKNSQKVSALNQTERQEYRKYEEHLSRIRFNLPISDTKIHDPKVAKLISDETKMYNDRENARRAASEMVLVYLIIIFEEFLTNILKALFRKHPEILKSSKKSITYEEAFKHASLSDLLYAISEKEIDGVIDSDIDVLCNYLSTQFHLELNKRQDWEEFRERFYRRHLTVHNYGVPDDKYINKTDYAGPIDWLEIDDEYLERSFSIFRDCAKGLYRFFSEKFSD